MTLTNGWTGPALSWMALSSRRKRGTGVGLTRRGKGTKWMIAADDNGIPMGLHLGSANLAEVTLAEQTLDAVRVPRPRGRPKQRRLGSQMVESLVAYI